MDGPPKFKNYRFRVIASYLSKVADFNIPHPCLAPIGGDPIRILQRSFATETPSPVANMWHCLCDPKFSHFDTTHDRQWRCPCIWVKYHSLMVLFFCDFACIPSLNCITDFYVVWFIRCQFWRDRKCRQFRLPHFYPQNTPKRM